MEALEKGKLRLRKHLLANKEKVAADLDALRKKSEGDDIFNYAQKLSDAFALNKLTISKEP
jgi:hypothetical protein